MCQLRRLWHREQQQLLEKITVILCELLLSTQHFLLNFPGILLLVSHDRYLIDRLTDQLFIFEGDGNVNIYSGNYTDYRLEQDELRKPVKELQKDSSSKNTIETAKRKLSFKEEQEITDIESTIKELETEILELTKELNSDLTGHTELLEISIFIQSKKDQIDDKTLRWLELIDLK